jgi:hypothetical protein
MPTTPDPETRKIIHTHEDAFPKKRLAHREKENGPREKCLPGGPYFTGAADVIAVFTAFRRILKPAT